jgi:serine/threonine protein kinase
MDAIAAALMGHIPIDVRYVDESLHAGRLIADRYLLTDPVSEEERTQVWNAEMVDAADALVSLCFFDRAIAEDRALLACLYAEAHAAAAIDSEHISRVLGYGVDAGVPYVAMEALTGQSLARYLETRDLEAGRDRMRARLAPAELVQVVAAVARGLEAIHDAGAVHRDLSPENIFVWKTRTAAGDAESRIEETLDVKLRLGVAKAVNDTLELARTLQRKKRGGGGAASYMSPEQILGKSPLDHKADLWALGIVAYEGLTGSIPFPGRDLGDQLVGICTRAPLAASNHCAVPDGFDDWFARAVSKEPQERFGTALEMAAALAETLETTSR